MDMLDSLGKETKLPPAMLRYRVGEQISAREFERIGRGCARLVKDSLEAKGILVAPGMSLLDFGCGCGRTIKWLLPLYPKAEFHGVDVGREAVDWCATNFVVIASGLVTGSEPDQAERTASRASYFHS
jgi:hypothetical protein